MRKYFYAKKTGGDRCFGEWRNFTKTPISNMVKKPFGLDWCFGEWRNFTKTPISNMIKKPFGLN